VSFQKNKPVQQKILTANGQKAYQRTDTEDRSLPYRNWLRTIKGNGMFLDVDMVKWQKINGQYTPKAITDITRCDKEKITQHYLDSITYRIFQRDAQGGVLRRLGALLQIPVYLVLFQKELLWLKVYDFQEDCWKDFTPQTWELHLASL